MRSWRMVAVVVAALGVVVSAASVAPAAPAPGSEAAGAASVPIADVLARSHDRPPLDRYEPAGGCYEVRTSEGGAPAGAPTSAAWRFQAVDLGRYLLRSAGGFLTAGADGLVVAGAPGPAAELELLGTGPDRF